MCGGSARRGTSSRYPPIFSPLFPFSSLSLNPAQKIMQMKTDMAKRTERAKLQESKYREMPDIVVRVVCKYRAELYFKISRKTKLARLFNAWTERMETNVLPSSSSSATTTTATTAGGGKKGASPLVNGTGTIVGSGSGSGGGIFLHCYRPHCTAARWRRERVEWRDAHPLEHLVLFHYARLLLASRSRTRWWR